MRGEKICETGNYVGNAPAASLDFLGADMRTLRQKYWVGEPRDCELGTAAEMKRRGFVGLYTRLEVPSQMGLQGQLGGYRRRWIE